MANQIAEPTYALVEVEGGFKVERFNPLDHCPRGWALPSVHLFTEVGDVSHLRDQILN